MELAICREYKNLCSIVIRKINYKGVREMLQQLENEHQIKRLMMS